jgi:predicted amidophosphoribosyltransferase
VELRALFAPGRCLSCRAAGPPACAACRAALQLLTGPACDRCGRPTERPVAECRECAGRRLQFASARAAVALEGPARGLVRAWKDRGLRGAADVAAELVTAVVAPPPAGLVLVPVPALAARAAWRGSDGARALAERLAAAWGGEVAAPLRRDGARPQRGLDRAGRRRNARAQFRAVATVTGAVVLVDDVYTTGATADVCAGLLRRAGAVRVDVVTFARAVRR